MYLNCNSLRWFSAHLAADNENKGHPTLKINGPFLNR